MKEFPTIETTRIRQEAEVVPFFSPVGFRGLDRSSIYSQVTFLFVVNCLKALF